MVTTGELLPPIALLANPTAPGTITLNWSPSPSAITTGYGIYRITNGEADYSLIAVRAGIGTNSHVDSGILPSTGAVYYIVSLREDWASASSPATAAIT